MKKITLTLMGIMGSMVIWAQGLEFEKGTFAEAMAKAKKEKKAVFLDVYTTWCGPCKQMAAQLFPQKEAGDIYNKNFINYKIDAEKGEGIAVAKKYNVAGYPTNLFLKPDGSVVYTAMGAGDMKWFINNANVAIEEVKDPLNWSDYIKKLDGGNTNKEFLEKFVIKGKRLGKNADKGWDLYTKKYLTKDLSKEQLDFVLENNQTLDNAAYVLLTQNKEKVNESIPNYFNEYSESLLIATVDKFAEAKDLTGYDNVVGSYLKNNSVAPVADNWYYKDYFFKRLGDSKKYEAYRAKKAEEILETSSVVFQKEDKAKLEETMGNVAAQLKASGKSEEQQKQYIQQVIAANPGIVIMASSTAANYLNLLASNIQGSKNKEQLAEALKWSTKSIELVKGVDLVSEAAYLDTYAHLLLENGQKEEALKRQEQAVNLAEKANKKELLDELKENLNKMK